MMKFGEIAKIVESIPQIMEAIGKLEPEKITEEIQSAITPVMQVLNELNANLKDLNDTLKKGQTNG